uniref:ASD2 domain-containing protein n=1 Tax=Ciona savignyi TaxID=51511 RepID=H2ZIQ1_CIOSA
YYKTSASKARILNLVKEKIADGEIDPEDDNVEDINSKKVELVLSIKSKLCELESMKETLQVEMRENERLGGQVLTLVQRVCSDREQEKYNIFAHDVDKIINLLLSLSGRMARVENAIEMLHPNADRHEMKLLKLKHFELTQQLEDAKQLEKFVADREVAIACLLSKKLNREQFADYEHYIKMKSALIMEQRELDDKAKLGEEQMQCLTESLSEEWQQRLQSI